MWKIDKDQCKGCELCIAVCKNEALKPGKERNSKGYLVPEHISKICISCMMCDLICPDMAITVTREKEKCEKS